MPTQIGNRSYAYDPRSVARAGENDPRSVVRPGEATQIGNRGYAYDPDSVVRPGENDPYSVVRPGETTGVGISPAPAPAQSKIMQALRQHATGLGKDPNDLTLPELNDFIGKFGGPAPNAMYKLPRNY